MLFNSYEFILFFLPCSFLVYFWLNKSSFEVGAKLWLVVSSLFFYSWWNINYLPLILSSLLVNYWIGRRLSNLGSDKQSYFVSNRKLLAVGVSFNLGLLGYFKYAGFLVENLNAMGGSLSIPEIALPLAISFFTFQQIAYLVDSYKGETKEYDFLNYAIFVTFFPQLIAGPIVHHKEMMPQFFSSSNMAIRYKNISLGLLIFSMGLFKKVVIADTFAKWATPGFDEAASLDFLDAWATSLSYTFQLYFDFSGYTDMAIGIALLFNIRLPVNFNSPYKATDIQDFWRRWHMTLSRFLRDYLYIPLGGSRQGEFRTCVNLSVTFILGGLWHGASWMFVIWGGLHGAALVIHRVWKNLGYTLWSWVAWLITFNFINITWIFFRAKDLTDAMKVIKGMTLGSGLSLPGFMANTKLKDLEFIQFHGILEAIDGGLLTIAALITALIAVLCFKNSIEVGKDFVPSLGMVVLTGFTLSSGIVLLNDPGEFLYFNF